MTEHPSVSLDQEQTCCLLACGRSVCRARPMTSARHGLHKAKGGLRLQTFPNAHFEPSNPPALRSLVQPTLQLHPRYEWVPCIPARERRAASPTRPLFRLGSALRRSLEVPKEFRATKLESVVFRKGFRSAELG